MKLTLPKFWYMVNANEMDGKAKQKSGKTTFRTAQRRC